MTAWETRGFRDAFRTWLAIEDPERSLRVAVADWYADHLTDPYRGARYDRQGDIWYGIVRCPDERYAVVISYLVMEREHVVVYSHIDRIHRPVG